MSDKEKVSRRGFVKTAGVAFGGLLIGGLAGFEAGSSQSRVQVENVTVPLPDAASSEPRATSLSVGTTGGSFGIGELDPGDVHYLSHERETEFYYVLSGDARITLDQKEIIATPGTFIFMPPGTKHKITNNGKETFRFIWCFTT